MSRFSALCFHFCQVPKKVFFFGQKLEPCGWTARPCPTWKKNQAAFSNWLVSLSPMEPTTKTTRESGSPGGPKGRYGSFSRQGRFWSGFWLIAAVVWRFLAVSVLQLIKFWNPFGMRPLTSNHICEVYESMSNWRAGKGTEVVGRTLVHQKAGASTSALEERAARRFFQFFTMVIVCICEVLLVMMYYDIRLWICGWLWWRCLWWWMVNQEGCMMMCGSVWWCVMYTDVFVMKTMKMMMNIMKIWWKRWHWYYGSIMVLFNVTNMCLHIYVYIYVIICCSLLVFFLESQPFASRRHVSYADMSPSPEEEAMGSYIYSDFTGLLFRFFFAADQWVESLTIQQPILLTSWGDAWQSALHSLFDAENHGNVAWL